MSNDSREGYIKGAAEMMGEGGVFIPAVLLRSYRKIGLSDAEVMLLMHLMAFRVSEFNEFPTWDQLAERTGLSAQAVGQMLQKLIKERILAIDEHYDSQTGITYEAFNCGGWFTRTAEILSAEMEPVRKKPAAALRKETAADLFSVFEQEFGRPLSPMECETIGGWIDQDRYPDELIRFALKESVFAGKLHFRYIDRILLEWSRNRITNADEARAHSQRFRGGKS
jgi:DNA replication protein